MINNSKIIKCFSALLMLLATSVSFALDDTGFEPDVPDNTSPIDTNTWMLLLIGLGYVFYKYRKLRKYNRL